MVKESGSSIASGESREPTYLKPRNPPKAQDGLSRELCSGAKSRVAKIKRTGPEYVSEAVTVPTWCRTWALSPEGTAGSLDFNATHS